MVTETVRAMPVIGWMVGVIGRVVVGAWTGGEGGGRVVDGWWTGGTGDLGSCEGDRTEGEFGSVAEEEGHAREG